MTVVIDGTNGVSGVDGTASSPAIEGTDSNTGIFFPAADTIAFAEGGAEVARFDSAGNFGLAVTPQTWYSTGGTSKAFQFGDSSSLYDFSASGNRQTHVLNNAYLNSSGSWRYLNSDAASRYMQQAGSHIWYTAASGTAGNAITFTQAMTLDASGNFFVGGGQIWDERLASRTTSNTVVGGFYSSSTSYTSSVIRAQAETAAGTGWYLFEGRASGGAFQYGIRGNGTVATSDERRKKNIEPARSYLQDICSIPVVKYNWKTDSDDAPKELGWLAQDVEKVFPNMVVTHHDGVNDDQEVLLLKKEVFVPMLMKCIQEQQAMIDELKAKVAALEGAA